MMRKSIVWAMFIFVSIGTAFGSTLSVRTSDLVETLTYANMLNHIMKMISMSADQFESDSYRSVYGNSGDAHAVKLADYTSLNLSLKTLQRVSDQLPILHSHAASVSLREASNKYKKIAQTEISCIDKSNSCPGGAQIVEDESSAEGAIEDALRIEGMREGDILKFEVSSAGPGRSLAPDSNAGSGPH